MHASDTLCVCHSQEATAIDDVYFPPGSTVTATYDQENKCFGKQKFIRVDFSKVLEFSIIFNFRIISLQSLFSVSFSHSLRISPLFSERQFFLARTYKGPRQRMRDNHFKNYRKYTVKCISSQGPMRHANAAMRKKYQDLIKDYDKELVAGTFDKGGAITIVSCPAFLSLFSSSPSLFLFPSSPSLSLFVCMYSFPPPCVRK